MGPWLSFSVCLCFFRPMCLGISKQVAVIHKEIKLAKKELHIVKELLFWSYANLAMAHSAVDRRQEKYVAFNYMIRAKLFKGLMEGSMNIRTIFDDEKVKLLSGNMCSYCGATEGLALDHVFPQKFGGKDTGDNLIYACKPCNSSKGKKDLMEWMYYRNTFPPLMILRRYLKLVIIYCIENSLMGCSVEDLKSLEFPFNIEYIPVNYPKPCSLILVAK